MKIVLAILVILPLVAQAFPAEKRQLDPFPVEKRQLNPILSSLLHLVHFDDLRLIIEGLLRTMGSDESEQACEAACPNEVHQFTSGAIESIAKAGCPVICTSFKELVHYVDTHVPHIGSTSATV